MPRLFPLSHAALAATLTVAVGSAAPQADFLALDVQQTGQTIYSRALGVSADGNVVVGSSGGGSQESAVRWVLDSAPSPSPETLVSGLRAFASGVSGDASTIVGRLDNGSFLWTSTSGGVSLGPPPAGYARAEPRDISDDGEVVVGSLHSSVFGSSTGGFRWTAATGMESLAPLPGAGGLSDVRGISGDGRVIVGSSYVLFGSTEAVTWSDPNFLSPVPLTNPNGLELNSAYAASPEGSVIVGAGGSSRGFRWTDQGGAGSFVGPGAVPLQSAPFDLSADGRVVVGSQREVLGADERALRWTAAGGERDLYYALIDAGVTDHLGWTLQRATGVSADGRVICGFGLNPAGETRGFVAILERPSPGLSFCDSAVPNSTGQPGSILADGSHVAADNDLRLHLSQLPVASFGFVLTSLDRGNFPGTGGSVGVLCLGGEVGRYDAQIFQSSAAGTAALELNLPNTPQPTGAVGVMAGDTWNFQGWHRDSVGGQVVSNFTDGVSVTFY